MANGTPTSSSATNPFDALPFPSPGDRIKAEDFRKLSQSLRLLYDSYALSSSLFGYTLANARSILTGKGIEIQKVMTVSGEELPTPADTSMDQRKIVQILPASLGGNQVFIVLTQVVDTRKSVPDLMGLTYQEASKRLRSFVGDVPKPGTPVLASQWIGRTLGEARLE